MAKRKRIKRKRSNRPGAEQQKATAALTSRHLQRWRALKTRFDRAHRAGLDALRRGRYDGLHAAIMHERGVINELRVLIEEWKALVTSKAQAGRASLRGGSR